jgi:hypothetical protein
MKRKTPAQLDREIAAALRRKPSSSRAKRSPNTRRAHATVNKDTKQADILMVANDAALSDQYDRAEKLLSQGKQRAIATAYTTVTPESATEGDFADRGWVDKEGDAIDVDADDIASEHEANSHAPVTDAIVKKAIEWLRDAGAYEASSSSYDPGVWYSSSSEVSDYSTGEERSEDFFLRNFTEAEEKKIFDASKRRWR